MVVALTIVVGIALGAVASWLVMRERTAALQRDLDRERTAGAEKAALLADAAASFEATMGAVAHRALHDNNESFLELAQSRFEQKEQEVEQLVAPIKESLAKVDGQLRGLETARLTAYTTLTEQVRTLADSQERLRGETGNLVTALRAPATRGRWGEIQLRRVVEMAGMLAHCDFQEQVTVTSDERRFRPDLIVKLPGGINVVVDSKVPLEAYLEAVDATDEVTRKARMQDHARQIRAHVAKLSAKAYWEQFQPTPQFVVLFLASDAFHSAALEQDPTLLEQGVNSRVLIATPTTLIALLQMVAYCWNQETVAESAAAVNELGRELYERLAVFTEHFVTLGKRLDGAVSAYNQTVGSFERRVLPQARRFPENGVTTRKELPSPTPVERSTQPPQTVELPSRADAA